MDEAQQPHDILSEETILPAVYAKISHLKPSVQDKTVKEVRRFLGFLRSRNVNRFPEITESHVEGYLYLATQRHGEWRHPSSSTVSNRRWALRILGNAVSLVDSSAPSLLLDRKAPARTLGFVRPLTEAEMIACTDASFSTLFDTRGPSLVALAQASAKPAEIALIRPVDLDLGRGFVQLPGTQTLDPRTNPLTPWGIDALHARMDHPDVEQSGLIAMSKPDSTPQSATASISGTLREILNRARVTDPHVRPSSLRAWSGLQVFDATGSIVDVARWLGTSSLDTAAKTINWDWRRL